MGVHTIKYSFFMSDDFVRYGMGDLTITYSKNNGYSYHIEGVKSDLKSAVEHPSYPELSTMVRYHFYDVDQWFKGKCDEETLKKCVNEITSCILARRHVYIF